eukprot:5422607-Pleurochrysis_carterae.AAC.2
MNAAFGCGIDSSNCSKASQPYKRSTAWSSSKIEVNSQFFETPLKTCTDVCLGPFRDHAALAPISSAKKTAPYTPGSIEHTCAMPPWTPSSYGASSHSASPFTSIPPPASPTTRKLWELAMLARLRRYLARKLSVEQEKMICLFAEVSSVSCGLRHRLLSSVASDEKHALVAPLHPHASCTFAFLKHSDA